MFKQFAGAIFSAVILYSAPAPATEPVYVGSFVLVENLQFQGSDKTFVLYPALENQVARYGVACSLGRYSLFDREPYEPPLVTNAGLSPFGNTLALAPRWQPAWRPYEMEAAFKTLAITCAQGDYSQGDTLKVLRYLGEKLP